MFCIQFKVVFDGVHVADILLRLSAFAGAKGYSKNLTTALPPFIHCNSSSQNFPNSFI